MIQLPFPLCVLGDSVVNLTFPPFALNPAEIFRNKPPKNPAIPHIPPKIFGENAKYACRPIPVRVSHPPPFPLCVLGDSVVNLPSACLESRRNIPE
jgi:hypothetical protein